MAPEIILGEVGRRQRADVYALGCVAYYLLTGQLVFEADTPMKMLLQHVQTQPVPPSQRTELPIPRELDELVLACLREGSRTSGRRTPRNCCDWRMSCKACEGWTDADRARVVADAPAGPDRAADHRSDLRRHVDRRGRLHLSAVTMTCRRQSLPSPFRQHASPGWIGRCRSSPRCAPGEASRALLLAANVFYLLALYSVLKIVRDRR